MALSDPDRLHGYATANVPRYTSYPTAAQFAPMREEDWRGWLAKSQASSISLYAHVLFCRELCWYCGCHAQPTRSEARIGRYAEALHAELALLAAALPNSPGLSHLHFGGGTPSILGAAQFLRLVEAIKARFPTVPGAEIAIELDPRRLDEAFIAALATAGVTRASIGLQDISPRVQALMGRLQPADVVGLAVERLRGAGIGAISLDMIYGLPGQTEADVAATAGFAASLGADRVSVFGYAHVPWMRAQQKAIDAATLPGTTERLAQQRRAAAVLVEAGYVEIGLDHFARPADSMALAARQGRLRRNFQGYTTDTATSLLGLGASAIACVPEGFAQNIADERRYLAAIAAGQLPVARGRARTAEEVARWQAMERILCDFRLDLSALPEALLGSALPALRRLAEDGLISLGGGAIEVLPPGRPLVRHVAACFDAELAGQTGRHSRAV
ncbi:anaerobic coproporphyrinogen III oxidase [Humitalea rosea]|uniref:Coproporphyrinogen-III oxidase n=1 Tax=Humitalea rosea TaxID=990373 RepID=A0A2W7HV17_9PROT|nr:oxygen-independent coproporphyrinogen III oxidase [Humitalea rosea]PZW37850.1 anaerobic coproporphyrinogen III oxidase [Humitalea rosea]